jgi:hypothetical protein
MYGPVRQRFAAIRREERLDILGAEFALSDFGITTQSYDCCGMQWRQARLAKLGLPDRE